MKLLFSHKHTRVPLPLIEWASVNHKVVSLLWTQVLFQDSLCVRPMHSWWTPLFGAGLVLLPGTCGTFLLSALCIFLKTTNQDASYSQSCPVYSFHLQINTCAFYLFFIWFLFPFLALLLLFLCFWLSLISLTPPPPFLLPKSYSRHVISAPFSPCYTPMPYYVPKSPFRNSSDSWAYCKPLAVWSQ